MTTTEEKILGIFRASYPLMRLEVTLDMKIYDHGFDSLDMIQAALEIEGEFDMKISDKQLRKWRTPRDVVEFINHKLAGS